MSELRDQSATQHAALMDAQQRWNARDQRLDAQLPWRSVPEPATTLWELDSSEPGSGGFGRVAAAGAPSEAVFTEDHPGALWGALQRDSLELRWDGDLRAAERTLDRWIGRVAGDLGPDDEWETSLSVTMPARDSAIAIPLLARGFAVVGVGAIRTGGHGAEASAAGADTAGADAGTFETRLRSSGITIRRATLADVPVLAAMDRELLEHDAQHGHVTVRPAAAVHLAAGIEHRLRRDPEWTWVLESDADAHPESDRAPVGYLSIEVDRDEHLSQCAPGSRVGHIQAMYLRPGVRGSGIGESVVSFAHATLEAAGVGRILLDYAALNPRSGPFWCRMGYRPLWHHWQRRPAM